MQRATASFSTDGPSGLGHPLHTILRGRGSKARMKAGNTYFREYSSVTCCLGFAMMINKSQSQSLNHIGTHRDKHGGPDPPLKLVQKGSVSPESFRRYCSQIDWPFRIWHSGWAEGNDCPRSLRLEE
jgi:hypothetical protein